MGPSYVGRTSIPSLIITNNSERICELDHGIKQNCYDGTKGDEGTWTTSKTVKDRLVEGVYHLLDEKEFNEVLFKFQSQNFPLLEKRVKRFVRTTPELERLVKNK